MRDYTNTAYEIRDANCDTVILPIGSIGQHGAHLPIHTDMLIANELGKRVARELDCDLLPALPISTCKEHKGKKGSVWMNPDTFYAMIKDIVISLKTGGYKNICLMPTHGGIFVLGPVIRELNAWDPDIRVIKLDYGECDIGDLVSCKNDLHAGEYETALMLYLDEANVHMDKAIDTDPVHPRPFMNYGSIYNIAEGGVWGHATKATKEQGKQIMDILVKGCAKHFYSAMEFFDNKKVF